MRSLALWFAQEPKSWLRPQFAEATGGCTVEIPVNAAKEPMVLEPILTVKATVSVLSPGGFAWPCFERDHHWFAASAGELHRGD
jgi:hypothetical protein